jgi:lysophospholipase L1-like esterase
VHYLALGDSISIDEYPFRETGRRGLGAASLFHRDLEEMTFENLAEDGATTEDVLRLQIPRARGRATIVTITAGGNDMLMNLRNPRPPARLVEGIVERLQAIIDQLHAKFPTARLLPGTIYDPSDGTSRLYGERLDREAEWLARVNAAIRDLARRHDAVTLIDIHRHFLGHGVTAPEPDRWYWSELIFEPNARGAAEVRRLWLEAL